MSGEKRIGILVGHRLPTNVSVLIENLGRLLSDEFRLDLIATREVPTADEETFGQFVRNAKGGSNKVASTLELYRLARAYIAERGPDVLLQITDPVLHGNVVGAATIGTEVQGVFRYSGDRFREYEFEDSLARKALVYCYNNVLCRSGIELTDRHIALGQYTADVLRRHGAESKQIGILPQPVDVGQFIERDAPEIRESILGPNGGEEILALTVGRISKRKGADILAEAAETIEREGWPIRLCIVGEGAYRSTLSSYDSVSTPGYVDHGEIEGYYNAADVLVHPSRIEGLPNVVLEARSCGTPVLGRPVGELQVLLDEPFDDAAELVTRIREGTWEYPSVDPFSIESLREKYVEFFDQV